MPETGSTQLPLFPLSAITVTGKPRPWSATAADDEVQEFVPQTEQLPLDDGDEMRSAA